LFLDEFDTLGKERGDTHETGEIKRVVSSLLMQIDDLPSHVLVVTATNHPELLDRAVWRRFQLRLVLPKPSLEEVVEWLSRLEDSMEQSLGVPVAIIAERLGRLSFGELEQFSQDVRRRYVLALPAANLKRIVSTRLTQWEARFNARRTTTKPKTE
jgi:SpoVK/Ycf46/Vps4 family AAA+-type ATPase